MVCIGDIFAIQFIMQSGMVCIGDAFNFFFFFLEVVGKSLSEVIGKLQHFVIFQKMNKNKIYEIRDIYNDWH
jgi:hypothetical protein